MATDALSEASLEAVRLYAERLGELLQSCARHQRHDPEVFLWNSRRALEAICHLLLTVEFNVPSRHEGDAEESLDKMINKLKSRRVLKPEHFSRFDHVRENGNLGVHIRKPEKEEYSAAIEDTSHMLPLIVDWMLDESRAAPFLEAHQGLRRAAAMIRGGGSPELPSEAAQIWQRRTEELERRLALVEQATDPGRHTAPRPGATGTTPGSAPPPSPAARSSRLGAGLGLLAGALLGGLIGAIGGGWMSSGPTTPPVEPQQPQQQQQQQQVATPAPRETCAAGKVLIAKRTIRLGQPIPERSGWPAARPAKIAPIEVGSFCLDEAPRTTAQLRGWAGSAEIGPGKSCDWRDAGDTSPAVCVSHQEAADYCAQAGGALPSVAQWEALLRSPQAGQTWGEAQREWAADTFPPAVFNRAGGACTGGSCGGGLFRKAVPLSPRPADDGELLWSWWDQEPNQRWANLGFRCVAQPAISG